MPLLAWLQNLPDTRQLRGLRHPLWFILLLMIVGAMCGYWGYRPLAEFAQRYGAEVCRQLDLPIPPRMPSYSTFRRVFIALDFDAFASVFNQWAQEYVPLTAGDWVAVDGKSIKSSVTHYDKAEQNFVMVVSLFTHKRGFVYHSQPMENQQTSEQHVVQNLLQTLDLQGVIVTADALHCQKNG